MITLTTYQEARDAFRRRDFRQALYDDGHHLMRGVIVNLHGDEHIARRRLENRLFRRDTFTWYERDRIPRIIDAVLAGPIAAGRGDLLPLARRTMTTLSIDVAGVDIPAGSGVDAQQVFDRLAELMERLARASTVAHATGDKQQIIDDGDMALRAFSTEFFEPSLARRMALVEKLEVGELEEAELPRDVLTTLIRNSDRLELDPETVLREVGVIDVATTVEGPAADGHDIVSFVASVSDASAIESVFDEFGTPDVVVNNAGIVRFGPLAEHSLDDFRAVVDVNLVGTYVVASAAARRWIASGSHGTIINVTSMNGVAAGPNSGAYAATKAGVAMLTSQMAIEWGPHGIRVNAIAPGLIDAGMSEPIYADPATRAARESKIPLGRLGTSSDITDVVVFLASEKSGYIHGQNIVVDGGVTGSVIAHLPRPQTVDAVGHDQ